MERHYDYSGHLLVSNGRNKRFYRECESAAQGVQIGKGSLGMDGETWFCYLIREEINMAKTSGSIRNSQWEGNIYTVNGKRMEYHELNEERKIVVRSMSKSVTKEMYEYLHDKSVALDADGTKINVKFTKSGIDHVARDAMITLSGKYMSRQSMVHIDTILAKSEYVPTTHRIYKERKDGKELFFRYKDNDGRGIYFKVAYDRKESNAGRHYLYSVTDR